MDCKAFLIASQSKETTVARKKNVKVA